MKQTNNRIKTMQAISKLFSEDSNHQPKNAVMDDANIAMIATEDAGLLADFGSAGEIPLVPRLDMTGYQAVKVTTEYLKGLLAIVTSTGAESVALLVKDAFPLILRCETDMQKELIIFLAPRVDNDNPDATAELKQLPATLQATPEPQPATPAAVAV